MTALKILNCKSLFSISQCTSLLYLLRISSLIFLEVHTVRLRKISAFCRRHNARNPQNLLRNLHISRYKQALIKKNAGKRRI